MMRRLLILATGFILLVSCADKTRIATYKDKQAVIAEIHRASVVSCDYKGRVKLQFIDSYGQTKTSAIIDKKCSGNMDIKILGLFGIVAAEVHVKADGYTVIKKGEDITSQIASNITTADIDLLKRALTLPPPLPDISYEMSSYKDGYIFSDKTISIYVSPEYMVTAAVYPDYSMDYEWDKGLPSALTVARGDIIINLVFTDRWKLY